MHTIGGNVEWGSCYGKQYGISSKNLKIELPYDPYTYTYTYTIELESGGSERDIHALTFIATLFTIAKIWKQLMSMNRWMNKGNVIYTCNRILFHLQKEENPAMKHHE